MRHFIQQMLSEHGSISMMRVLSLVSCVAAIVIAIMGLNKPQIDYSGLSLLSGAFLSAAFGGKIMQKKIELNGTKTTTEEDVK